MLLLQLNFLCVAFGSVHAQGKGCWACRISLRNTHIKNIYTAKKKNKIEKKKEKKKKKRKQEICSLAPALTRTLHNIDYFGPK